MLLYLPLSFAAAITATGLIWARYSTQIVPVNYNLMTVNMFMASVGIYQLYRIFSYRNSAAYVAPKQ